MVVRWHLRQMIGTLRGVGVQAWFHGQPLIEATRGSLLFQPDAPHFDPFHLRSTRMSERLETPQPHCANREHAIETDELDEHYSVLFSLETQVSICDERGNYRHVLSYRPAVFRPSNSTCQCHIASITIMPVDVPLYSRFSLMLLPVSPR